MRRASFIFALTLTSWLFAAAPPGAATSRDASAYRDSVAGFQTAGSDRQGISLYLSAEGDLPGMTSVSLRRDGNQVNGGKWTLTVLPPDAGPTASEKGRLSGAVTGGTLVFNSEGAVARVEGLQLTIQNGTGNYVRVKSGSGTIDLAPHAESPARLVGTLTLKF